MSRVHPRSLAGQDRALLFDLLWTSIAELQSKDEVRAFFKDLLSESESIMLARRIRIAQLLLKGKTYEEIEHQLKTAHATIASVQRWLVSGSQGYEPTLKRFEIVLEKRRRKREKKIEESRPYSFAWLKRRYPLHFLLLNLMDKIEEE